MTERLYQRDSYLREFDARVTWAALDGVRLDQTAFFPTGGGVLGDEGTLAVPGGETFRVVETVDTPDGVLHRLDRPGLAAGDTVRGALDWARRYLRRATTPPRTCSPA